MKILIKILIRIMFAVALLAMGFAAAFPIGQQIGFTRGSEWALKQAEIVAREAGVFMPVSFESGQFHIILRQPGHLYSTAWKLAERYEEELQGSEQDEREQAEIAQMAQLDSRHFAEPDKRVQVEIAPAEQPDSRLNENENIYTF